MEPDEIQESIHSDFPSPEFTEDVQFLLTLGLWDGWGHLPESFAETLLVQKKDLIQGMVDAAIEDCRLSGIRGIGSHLPLLRFLDDITRKSRFPFRGSYSDELCGRFRKYIEQIVAGALPAPPNSEKLAPLDIVEEFIDVSARLLEIRRRVRARSRDVIVKKAAAEDRYFPFADYKLLFPNLSDSFLRKLEEQDLECRRTRRRKPGEYETAFRIISHRRGVSIGMVRRWLEWPIMIGEIRANLGDVLPLKKQIRDLSHTFRPR